MANCLESYIKHRPILVAICNSEHLSKISKSLNYVKFRKFIVCRTKLQGLVFVIFVNSIAYINIAIILSNCKTFISEMNMPRKKSDLNQKNLI